MRVISKRPLVEFYGGLRPEKDREFAKRAMDDWYAKAAAATWANFAQVKATFPQTDLIVSKRHGQVLVFDVRGNHYRIVCTVHFDRQTLFVRYAGSHEGYNRLDMENL